MEYLIVVVVFAVLAVPYMVRILRGDH